MAGCHLLPIQAHEGGVQQGVHHAVRVRQAVFVGEQRCELPAVAMDGARKLDLLNDEARAVWFEGEGDGGRKWGVAARRG